MQLLELQQHDGEERDDEEHVESRRQREHQERWLTGRLLRRTWKDWQGKEGKKKGLLKEREGEKRNGGNGDNEGPRTTRESSL